MRISSPSPRQEPSAPVENSVLHVSGPPAGFVPGSLSGPPGFAPGALSKSTAPKPRWPSHAASLGLHAAAFVLLMQSPEIRLPQAGKSEYEQAIKGREEKLVWYKLDKKLPDVTPRKETAAKRPPKATTRAKEEIVASARNAPKRPQIVWSKAPELKVQPVNSPNLLAVKVPAPPPPPRKAFVAPLDIQKQAPQVRFAANAPTINAPEMVVASLSMPKPAKPFIPPPKRVPVEVVEVAPPPEAPELAASSDLKAGPGFSFRAPPKPFTAPSARQVASKQVNLDAASAPDLSPQSPDALLANSNALNLAVVGLHPADKSVSIPEGSSPAQFSAGPRLVPDGANSAGNNKGLSVPDLFVRGAHDAKPDLVAQAFAAPTSPESLRNAMHSAGAPSTSFNAKPVTAEHSGPVKVSNAPDARFNGRDVYMMAIQMPNLTSYSGSWLMWYADRTARETGLAPIAAPIPYRKVDPKYIATAVEERVEGKVQLACVIGKDGHVSTVALVRGLDDRLNQSAEEALSKWEFSPATRDGQPIDVDVLVEIPFNLAPRVPAR